jgi:hypothetical protein
MSDQDDNDDTANLFQEPDGYYKEEAKPSEVQHQCLSGHVLHLHLASQNPLWVGTCTYTVCRRTGSGGGSGRNKADDKAQTKYIGPPPLARRTNSSRLSRSEQDRICRRQDSPRTRSGSRTTQSDLCHQWRQTSRRDRLPRSVHVVRKNHIIPHHQLVFRPNTCNQCADRMDFYYPTSQTPNSLKLSAPTSGTAPRCYRRRPTSSRKAISGERTSRISPPPPPPLFINIMETIQRRSNKKILSATATAASTS